MSAGLANPIHNPSTEWIPRFFGFAITKTKRFSWDGRTSEIRFIILDNRKAIASIKTLSRVQGLFTGLDPGQMLEIEPNRGLTSPETGCRS